MFLFTSGNDKLNNGSKFKSETVIVEKTHAGDTVCLNNVIIIEREGGRERERERGGERNNGLWNQGTVDTACLQLLQKPCTIRSKPDKTRNIS